VKRQSEGVRGGLDMQCMDVKGRGGRYSWRQPIWIRVALEQLLTKLNNNVLNDEMIERTLVNASGTVLIHSTSQLRACCGNLLMVCWKKT